MGAIVFEVAGALFPGLQVHMLCSVRMASRNIGIVTTWFERGAAYVSRQYRHILQGSHQTFVYARGGESYAVGDPLWDGPGVTWAKKGLMPVPMSIDINDFAQWIRRNRIEIVFFNEQHWWEPVLYCIDQGLLTGSYVDYYTKETVPFFDCFDFLICNTQRHYSVFETHSQSFYIPWGTDIQLFRPTYCEPVHAGAVTFFHSAGLNPPRKGCDYVLKAFAQLSGNARLLIHTQYPLRQCFAELIPLLDDLQQRGTLTITEQTLPAPGLYTKGDVYVYPSRLDGIGLTIPEAIACGLPVIATDCPPMNEFITAETGRVVSVADLQDRGDGYYWPQSFVDLADLTAQMQWYVDHQAELPQLRQAARTHAESYLDWEKNARDLSTLFDSVRRLDDVRKNTAYQAARSFEHNRARASLRSWVSYHWPSVIRTARQTIRHLRPA